MRSPRFGIAMPRVSILDTLRRARRAKRFSAASRSAMRMGWSSSQTIYPGWYRGRTTHIHFKVHFGNQTLVTSQLYFPETLSSTIYTTVSPYSSRGTKDTSNAGDGFTAAVVTSFYAGSAGWQWLHRLPSPSALQPMQPRSLFPGFRSCFRCLERLASVYTSELAITNRAATAATVGFSYTAPQAEAAGRFREHWCCRPASSKSFRTRLSISGPPALRFPAQALESEYWQFGSPASLPLPRVL